MSDAKLEKLEDVIATAMERSPLEWLYLPRNVKWCLDSEAATLESEEVPPELEDEPDAGVPLWATQRGLKQVVPVSTLQDIITNAKIQKPNASPEDLFRAFSFYYENDAFMKF